MSDVLTDLATFLDAALPLTAGTDLFGNDMPNEPDAITVLYESPGSPPVETMGADSKPAVIRPRVQVQTRALTHDAARARAREVYDQLVMLTNATVNGVYYLRVVPMQEPFLLHRDGAERPIFAFNLEVQRVAE